MQLLHLDAIGVPADRQRQEFDPEKVAELAYSIQTVGLLQPIVVRRSTEGPVLVAGERRIRAIKDIYALGGGFTFEGEPVLSLHVPSIDLGELTEVEWTEAEYDENVKRANLTWQEEAAATVRLERLRRMQAALQDLPPPTPATLAQEIHGRSDGDYQDTARKELIVAKHFARPEVAGAKTLDEAWKFLKREEEVRKRVEHAERVGATFSSSLHRLYNEDSFTWLKNQIELFDVILTDPPFGMSADEFGDAGGRAWAHSYDDSPEAFLDILNLALPHLYRLAKPQAHLYWFCDLAWFAEIKERLEVGGWKCFRTPLIWHKPNAWRAPWPQHGPRRSYELILYAIKGDKPINQVSSDVITVPTEPGTEGAQKPVELFVELLKRSSRPGDSILDPFCGKGTIFLAADRLKCQATGIELDPAEYSTAVRRLDALRKEVA